MLKEQQTYSISEAAGELGVSASYLRLAERLRLIPEAGRTSGGHRRYTMQDVEELRQSGVGQRKQAIAERNDG